MIPVVAFFLPLLYTFFLGAFIFVLVSKFPRDKHGSRKFFVQSASPQLSVIMLVIIILSMTPPIGLLILMGINGLENAIKFENPWNGFFFNYITDTLADELRIFSTLVLVTLLFTEFVREAKHYDVFSGITNFEKKITRARNIWFVIFAILTVTAILELVFAALVQHGTLILLNANPTHKNVLHAISWFNGAVWVLCFTSYLFLSSLIFYRSLRGHADSVTGQKSIIMLFSLNVVSDIACLVVALFSYIFSSVHRSAEASVNNFAIFYDVSAVINIGFYAFVFVIIGPLNTQIEETRLSPIVQVDDQQELIN